MSVTLTPSPVSRTPPPTGTSAAVANVVDSIQTAAQATGASFEYLLATAKVESNLDPNSRAGSSSATGLFQFIEQTWLGLMKSAGQALGLGRYADAISRDAAGRYQVTDARLRQEILQLRRDPGANATMGAVFTQHNRAELGQRIGRPPTDAELYIAHFFGSGGAARLIESARTNPQASANTMFPAAARANRSIFYDPQGQPRSVAGVYSELDRRYQLARADVAPVVGLTTTAAQTVPPSDPARTTEALAAAQPPAEPPPPDFRTLFHNNDGERGPVAAVVSELWGKPVAPLLAPATGSAAAGPLDLFQQQEPDIRALFRGGAA